MRANRFTHAVATVSGLTGLSRILGFVRDQMLGAFIGPGLILDAWQAAFAVPNAFRRLFAEGAMSAAFVPMLRDHLSGQNRDGLSRKSRTEGAGKIRSEEEGKQFAHAAFSFLLLILMPLIGLMILAMPWIMDLITGFDPDSEARRLAIFFGRIMLPYLLLMSLMALVGGVLDALGRFAAKALAPTMLNVIFIGVLFSVYRWDLAPGSWLSWATLVAGFAQLLVVWIPAAQLGWAPALTWPRGMRPFLGRMIPGLIANGGYQISFLVVMSLASSVEQDLSHRYFADRLYQLPLGLIGIALNTVLLSSLSNLIVQNRMDAARGQLNRALELSLILSIPITAACLFVGSFLFEGLFQYRAFSAEDTRGAALALYGFAFGIPAAVGQKVLQPAFFAQQNTRDPMLHSLASVVVAVGFSYGLYPSFGLFGLCLAASISSWFGFFSLAVHLNILRYFQPDHRVLIRLLPMILAAGLMILALKAGMTLIGDFDGLIYWVRMPLTLMFIALAAGLYFGFAFVFGAFDKADLQKLRRQD